MAGNRGVEASASMKEVLASEASRGSPLKHQKNNEDIKQSNAPPGWHLHVFTCDGLLTNVLVANITMTTNAHLQPLVDALANQDPSAQDDPIKNIGIAGGHCMCSSLECPSHERRTWMSAQGLCLCA